MFANEDFDLDENFLNDISQKETEYYSQTFSSDEESCVKKRFKNNDQGSKPSSSESSLDLNKSKNFVSESDFLIPNSDNITSNKNVRKNLILERLTRRENNISDPGVIQRAGKTNSQNLNTEKSNSVQETVSHSTYNESRRNLISERFKRNNIKTSKDNYHKTISDNSELMNCRKSSLKSLKPLQHKHVTVVRQFPGPAGLMPDVSSGIVTPLIPDSLPFDDSNDGTEADLADDSSIISKYCSQNTTNTFSEGAWQSLMSDLSPDFLSGHEISTIQQKIVTNSYKNNKVPFLAGIVQRVDYNFPDPLVVLKDCTGTIEGTICKDILLEYPHSLDIGVVLFLGNVGLLTMRNILKKCHVIITLKNILNIYSVKGQIFDVTEMEDRLKTLNNRTKSPNSKIPNKPNSVLLKSNENLNPQLPRNNLQNNNSRDFYSNQAIAEILPASRTSMKTCVNVLEKTRKNLNSFQTDDTNPNPRFDSGDIEDFDDNFAASFFDIDDNLVFLSQIDGDGTPEVGTVSIKKHLVIPEKKMVANAVDSTEKVFQESELLVSSVTDSARSEITENSGVTEEKARTVEKEKNLTTNSDIQLKLSRFRSDSGLTPPNKEEFSSEGIKVISKTITNNCVESRLSSGFLFNDENDSDEDFLSQLDVESIVSRYNKLNDVN